MAVPGHHKIAFRFSLPDGPHIAIHNTYVDPKWDKDTKHNHLKVSISQGLLQNPDAKLDEDSFVDLTLEKSPQAKLVEMRKALKAENPDRPLADEMGLDATNRLLTNPELARTIAAANELDKDA